MLLLYRHCFAFWSHAKTNEVMQSVPVATNPKPLSSKYSYGIVKIIQIQYNLQYLLAQIIEVVYLG